MFFGVVILLIIALTLLSVAQLLNGSRILPPCGKFVYVNGRRVHYRIVGTGTKTAIYLHGSEGSLNDMSAELAEALGTDFRVVLFDRPGHGYSARSRETSDPIRANLECARGLVRELGNGPVLVIAHSWGALPALKWATLYPSEISGVVIAAGWFYQTPTPVVHFASRYLGVPIAVAAWILLAPVRGVLLRRLAERAFKPGEPDAEFLAQCITLWLNRPAAIMSVLRELGLHYSPEEFLVTVRQGNTVEMLLIAGAADVMVDPEEHTFRFHRAFESASLIIVQGAGHMPVRTSYKELVPHILCFAQRTFTPSQQITIWHGAAATARRLVLRYGWNSTSYQTLNAGMSHWFSGDFEAMAAFVTRFGIRVCAGPPVCSEADLPRVAEQFTADTRQHNERVCFFAVEDRLCNVLQDKRRLFRLQIGSQPVWDPTTWHSICMSHKSIRMQLHRAHNKGVVVTEQGVAPPPQIGQLVECLQDWQSRRTLPPLKFLTESVPLELLTDRRLFTAVLNGRVVGYLAAAPVPLRNGWLIEQIVRSHHAPNGTAELLVNAAMNAFADEGAQYATLGLAPLSLVADGGSNAPTWVNFLTLWMRAHGNRFYNFGGLEAFKAKLRPTVWEPIYLVSLDRQISLCEILAVASAFCAQNLTSLTYHVVIASMKQEKQRYLATRQVSRKKNAV